MSAARSLPAAQPLPLPVRARPAAPQAAADWPAAEGLLALLREAAAAARAEARAPLAGCAAIDPAAPPPIVARALLRALPTALHRRPRVWSPGARGRSFDEAWLVALARALAVRDADSACFLLASRTRPDSAPLIAALMRQLLSGLGLR
jgi:hypothetical protein